VKASAMLVALTLLLGGSNPGRVKNSSPPVFLNHFYIVLDSATYHDIERSPFLRREFAATERRTTVREDMSYTGLYVYGANTYFEFFDVSNSPSPRVGDSGIGFGVDQAGGLQAVGREQAAKISIGPEPVTRQYEGRQVPWFYTGGLKDSPSDSGFSVWLMEYHPRFLAAWNPQPDGQNRGVSRRQILRRYAAVLKDIPARPYFVDVVALTVAIDEPAQKSLVKLCKLLSYGERTNGGTKVLQGPGVELRLIPQAGGARGIREIRMRVRGKPMGRAEFRFGPRSVLRFEGNGLATWSF
jgi:hypothetical protein